ncbi:unnamed protein product, partial [Brenthis ino]
MLAEICTFSLYTISFLSLIFIDYLLGNGFVDAFQKIICRIICFVRKSLREDEELRVTEEVNLPVLVVEIVVLGLTISFLNRYKKFRGKDRIDALLQQSREALQQTNEFLEKWRLRRINWQVSNEDSYLDEEPQEIKPLKLELPILHLAIIDALGTSRNQLERGDGADTIKFTDSTILSMTSLLDDLQSIPEVPSEEKFEE